MVKRAASGRTKLGDLVDEICALPCPGCGRLSLVVEDPKFSSGVVIYCERSLCSWKPYNRHLKPEMLPKR